MKKVVIILFGFLLFTVGCGSNISEGLSVISPNVEFDENDYEKIINASNDLGFDLITTVEPDAHGNIFISPLSLYMALSMVYNGADGDTKEEMANVLQTHGLELEELNRANASMLSNLYKDMDSIELHIGNSLWLNEEYQFEDQFAKNATGYFNGEVQKIDVFHKKTPDIINKWVKDSTNGKINKVVDAPLDRDLVSFLINTIYFKGGWKHTFNKEYTKEAPFYLHDGSEITVPLMSLDEKLRYFETEDFQAIKLPYGDGEISMNVFLPREHIDMEEFQGKLTRDYMAQWSNEFQKRQGTILLPRFELKYETKLNDVLKQLGINDALEGTVANFSKMIKGNKQICISEVKQKTYIDVHEKGTEAAAATSIEMIVESALTDKQLEEPFYMEVNRPFFLTITDEQTGVNLFMGTIYQPK